VNTKAQTLILSVRRLIPQEPIFRAYFKSVNAFPKDGEERFKIVYAKLSEMDKHLKLKCPDF
jgi:hypothetical protein